MSLLVVMGSGETAPTMVKLLRQIFEATEALRFSENATEASLYVHTTYVLMQNHEGWRIAHVHSSQAAEERVAASIASVAHSLH